MWIRQQKKSAERWVLQVTDLTEGSGSSMGNKTSKIKAFEPATVFIGTILAVLSAIVCMQILGKVGVSANTSILGAIFAMLVSRIPTASMKGFRNLERQNYIQTISSGA